jgi:hypothetical protein
LTAGRSGSASYFQVSGIDQTAQVEGGPELPFKPTMLQAIAFGVGMVVSMSVLFRYDPVTISRQMVTVAWGFLQHCVRSLAD